MMDLTNSIFEFGGMLALFPSILAIIRDKRVAGVSILTPVFFATWGFWNLPYYTTLHQTWSACAALLLATTNTVYLYLIWKYSYGRAEA